MDLFELLLIAVFLVFPLIDQLIKGARGKGGQTPPQRPRGQEPSGRSESREEPVSAADMVPEDLWAVLTGETRTRGGGATTAEAEPGLEQDEDAAPWSDDEVAWEPESWEEAAPEPVSLEYTGPEAYSLEELDIEPVSLERPIPTPEARHRAFHELVDRAPPRTRRRRSALARALSDPDSVRQAVVLSEILGPPKGLE